jgi:NAD(P)-dependent dehydrogenase (short-subunit alcohol dehydrogenase family)
MTRRKRRSEHRKRELSRNDQEQLTLQTHPTTEFLPKRAASVFKIRVNSINPGATDTEGARASGVMETDFVKDIVSTTPLRRLGQPEDIGRAAESAWLTGEVLLATGGHR